MAHVSRGSEIQQLQTTTGWNQAVQNAIGGTVSYAMPKASTTYTSASLGMSS